MNPYHYWWTTFGKYSPTTTGCCTSNIKDPDYIYEFHNGKDIHRIEIVADVEYKEVKDDNC